MNITKGSIEDVIKRTIRWPKDRKWTSNDQDQRIRAFFGVPSNVIADLWNRVWVLLNDDEKKSVDCCHILYALVFLKVYATEEVLTSIVGWPTKKTFRKWAWFFIDKIGNLKDEVIVLDNRFNGLGEVVRTNCFMSVDGTHCPIFEPWPFDKKYYSKKLNGPGLSYEVGVCIKTGHIVWINGPFVASTNDATIFKSQLTHLLCEDEAVEVDAGYKGDHKMKSPNIGMTRAMRKEKSVVRGRHENVNGRLKQFNVLTTHFRHTSPREKMMEKHGKCFAAVAVITQLKFLSGESIYDVEYNASYF